MCHWTDGLACALVNDRWSKRLACPLLFLSLPSALCCTVACPQKSRGNLLLLTILLCLLTAFVSAWLDNVTTM